MISNAIIYANGLCKHYRLYQHKTDRVKEALHPFRRKYHTLFSALRDVNFSVNVGESVGIVGVNGSGKSTLLKILCGVLTPSLGNVQVNGRVSALLELGAGFHPERTGLENLYFQGVIQGIERAEMEGMIPDILEFADIGEFIHQPVKIYSSGMFVRLAFAAAIHSKPDILIVDEALAVGDARFQRRCFDRIKKMKEQGVTFIFVSHATEQIQMHCDRALLLSEGQILMDDAPRPVINRYLDLLFGRTQVQEEKNIKEKEEEIIKEGKNIKSDIRLEEFIKKKDHEDIYSSHWAYNPYEYRWGDQQAKIIDVFLSSPNDINMLHPGDFFNIYLKVVFLRSVFRPIIGCTIKNKEGVSLYGSNSEINGTEILIDSVIVGDIVCVHLSMTVNLAPGEYFISLGVVSVDGDVVPHDRRYDSLLLTVHGPANFFGIADLKMSMERVRISEC